MEGQNIAIEYRSAEDRSRLAELANELVRLNVEVIVAQDAGVAVAKKATEVVPIVFGFSGDPVVAGFVGSLARPGGNMTGKTFLSFELAGKRLELPKEVVPKISRVAVLANPAHPGEERELRETQAAASTLGITLKYLQARVSGEFGSALDTISKERADGLLVLPEAVTMAQRTRLAEFAAKRRLPTVFGWKEYVEAGGLMSYGPSLDERFRRLAVYVDKILKGAKPADLPVEQPTRFELVINMKTANALSLTIPQSVLIRADQAISGRQLTL